ALVLAFSLSREIAEWDRVALTESITLSLLALLVAASILYVQRPGRALLGAVLVLGVLWAFVRDANAYDLLFVAPVLVVAAVVHRGRRALHGAAAAGFLLIFVASVASSDAGLRWEYSFYSTMGLRLLEDTAAVDYFTAHGMPMSGALVGRTGHGAGDDHAAFFRDPRLYEFRQWSRQHGQRTYLMFLLTHPRAGIITPGSRLVDLLSPLASIRAYAGRAWTPLNGTALQGMPSAWLFPDRDAPGFVLAGAVGFAAAAALAVGWRRSLVVPAILVATALPLAVAIYHADAGDLGRHEMIPAAQVRLGLWLLLLVAVDMVALARRRDGGATPAEPQSGDPGRTSVAYIVARINVGGVARLLNLLATRMDPQFDSVVLTGEPDAREGSLVDEVRASGAVVLEVPGLRRRLSPIEDVRAFWWLYRYLRRTRPQIVSTHTAKAGAIGRVAAIAAGVPVRVHTFHGHVLEGYFDPVRTAVFRGIERVLGACSTRVIAVSPGIAADLRRFAIGGRKLTVIRSGFELDGLTSGSPTSLREELGIALDAPLAGIVGRLAPIKNHGVFLLACRQVHERLPKARFLVVGDGELAPSLRAETERLGLAEVVRFTGWRSDLADVYAALDVVVCSSNNEGLPAALVEAGAAGKPVVATDVGGVADLVADGVNGMLVPSGDATALAEAIGSLLADRERAARMGQEGRRIANAGYAAQRMVDETAALYRELLGQPAPVAVRA
ncbi:MAG TPA: glycosyltransferase family 4 protein, partial [Terriglobales bacterium]|nr:glycosyltransferase family 4 protein [Terriglobales bacterium]